MKKPVTFVIVSCLLLITWHIGTRYPNNTVLLVKPKQDHSPPWIDLDSQELWRELTELQHPKFCKNQRALVYKPMNAGLGAEIHWLTVVLSIAYRENRTMVLDSGWVYGNCEADDLSCYFSSQGCSRKDLSEAVVADLDSDEQVIIPKLNIPGAAEYIPFKYRHRGQLWWRSQLVSFLLSFNTITENYIRNIRIDIPQPYTSLHIRHGDSCTDKTFGHSCAPVADFIAAIREHNFPKNLFISTDTQEVVEELMQYSNEFNLYFSDEYRSKNEIAKEVAKLNSTFVSLSLLANIEMLSSGDAFVGTFGSNIGRIVYEVMYYKKKARVDYVSLDLPYFFMPGVPVPEATKRIRAKINNHE